MSIDVLFMTWNCPDCARLKTEWEDFGQVAFEDEPNGKQGQALVVVQTYSNTGAKFVLQEYGLFPKDVFTPALFTCNGSQITDVDKILDYLKREYA